MFATHFTSMFSQEDLDKTIADGYVSVQMHPSLPLRIFNYSPSAQYDGHWTEVTTRCRGLILDSDGNIVARPFEKFKNYSEYTEQGFSIPAGDPIVSEKMDGSLGIIYTYNGSTAVATRGSFASDQALWATDWLHKSMPDFSQPDGVTTLVEIIYPQNRIVVDYNGAEELCLLGAIDNATGADIPYDDIDWWNGPWAPRYPYTVDKALSAISEGVFDEDEGVVLTWPRDNAPAFRLKVKSARYIELHRIVTNLSTRSVHEALANGTFDDLIAITPDEFHPWVRKVADSLSEQYDTVLAQVKFDLMDARWVVLTRSVTATGGMDADYTRKDLAEAIIARAKYPGLCFALEDGKVISDRIWDMIRPAREMAVIEDV